MISKIGDIIHQSYNNKKILWMKNLLTLTTITLPFILKINYNLLRMIFLINNA